MLDGSDSDDTNSLSVYQSRADVPDEVEPQSVFVVDEEVAAVSPNDAQECYDSLFNVSLDSLGGVPVYDLVSHNLWRDGLDLHGSGPYTMNLLVVVTRGLRKAIQNQGADSVVCHDLDRLYRLAVVDACETASVTCSTSTGSLAAVVEEVWFVSSWLIPLGLWLLDMVWSMALDATPGDDWVGSVAVVYPTGRPATIEPIRDRLDLDVDYYLFRKSISRWLNLEKLPSDVDARPFNRDVTPRTVAAGLAFLARYAFDTWVTRGSATTLAEEVESTTGVSMPGTVDALYRRATVANLPACLLHLTAQTTFDRRDYQAILSPNNASRGKAVAFAALDADVDVYRLPHSITVPYGGAETTTYPHTVFLEGDIGVTALGDPGQLTTVVSGHPKLIRAAESLEGHREVSSKRDSVLLATQPYDDAVRVRFVEEAGSAAQRAGYDVCIKIHPGEDRSFYDDLVARSEKLNADRVTVETDELYRHVAESTAVVTIASNVAIESIVVGTPALCYNVWSPNIWTPVYATLGDVPWVQDPDALVDRLDGDLSGLYETQRDMLRGPYRVLETSLDEAADVIEATVQSGQA